MRDKEDKGERGRKWGKSGEKVNRSEVRRKERRLGGKKVKQSEKRGKTQKKEKEVYCRRGKMGNEGRTD